MSKNSFILVVGLLLTLLSCKENRYLRGEKDKSIQVQFHRFEQDFNALKRQDINEQKNKLATNCPSFFEIYNQGVIRLGAYKSPNYNAKTLQFLNDSIYMMVFDTVSYYFQDLSEEEKKLTEAFRNYHLLFPERQIPAFYTHISGFNEPIVVGDSILSISLENYLGENHLFYKNLGTYTYMLPKKNRENLPVDAVRGWLMSEFPYDDVQTSLLNNMIHEGKLLFIQSVIMPQEEAYRLLGLTPQQYEWCEINEKQLWTFAIEKQHLYSKHQLTIAKYMQDGPFFNFYGSGSSPLVGKYLGWKIVSSYMKNNKNQSINTLMTNKNGQNILQTSGYRPKN